MYEMTDALDIKLKAPYPAGALSDFTNYSFQFDGIDCASMESLLQSLKVEDVEKQVQMCARPGPAAQNAGRRYDWNSTGTLWWKGEPIDRLSVAYQDLLDRAYQSLFTQSEAFRTALAATADRPLVHTLGKSDPCDTILTAEEFCTRLERLRGRST